MEGILNFLEQNYLWFLLVAGVLILGLIGYYVDFKKDADDSPFKKKKKTKVEMAPDNMDSIAAETNTNMSLNEMINNSVKNSNGENNNLNS